MFEILLVLFSFIGLKKYIPIQFLTGLQETDVNHDTRISALEESGGGGGSQNGGLNFYQNIEQ